MLGELCVLMQPERLVSAKASNVNFDIVLIVIVILFIAPLYRHIIDITITH